MALQHDHARKSPSAMLGEWAADLLLLIHIADFLNKGRRVYALGLLVVQKYGDRV